VFARKYNGDYSALLGVMCVKLGKLQLYMNRQRDALEMFKEASKILKVTHGEYHSLYKEDLVPLMMQASIEN
jgi:[histone H3]-lysine4/36 N-trimethyltransferase SMYD